MAINGTLFATGIFALAIYLIGKRWSQSKHDRDFASAHGCSPAHKYLRNPWWPPLGLDKLFPTLRADRAGRLPAFMLEEFEKHGHTYTQHAGGLYVILTRSPAIVHTVCVERFKDYELGSDRTGNFGPLVREGILAQDGAEWTKSRVMLRPHFSRNINQDFSRLEVHFQHLLKRLPSSDKEAIEMGDLFLKLSTDFSTEAVLGQSTDSLVHDFQDWSKADDKATTEGQFAASVEHVQEMLALRGQMMNFYWVRDSPRFRRSCHTCQKFVDNYLREAKASPEKATTPIQGQDVSFMHSLVAAQKASSSVMRDQLLSLLLASRDTTAAFLSWTVYALARHPQVFQNLRREITASLSPSTPPTVQDITSLSYLRDVLNETLRVFPVVPMNARSAKVDTVLPEGGGPDGKAPLAVPAGTKVAFNIFCMQRRKDIFGTDANDFRPERWQDEAAGSANDYGGAFVPFILGPRVCLGKNLAMMNVSYLIVRLLQVYDRIDSVQANSNRDASQRNKVWPSEETQYGLPDGDTTYHIGVTMTPRDGVFVRLRKA